MKNTKRSMLVSGLCLLLTAVMLIGSTFAWFTDSVTNQGNTIEAGTLGISLTHEGDKEMLFSSQGFWFEPGRSQMTVATVANGGSLWLKYTMSFANVETTGTGDDITKVLDVYKVTGDEASAADLNETTYLGTMNSLMAAGKLEEEGVLAPQGQDGSSETFTLIIKMQESASNEYQNCGVEFDVVVNATQYNEEPDGFGNPDYDENAYYSVEVGSAEAFLNAIQNLQPDQTMILTHDITFDGVLPASVGGVTNIDLNGHTLTASKTDSEAVVVEAGQILNISNGNLILKRDKDRGKRMPAFSVEAEGELSLTNVTYTCDGIGLYLSGDADYVGVENSRIYASGYAIQTAPDSGYELFLDVVDSHLKSVPDSQGNATGTVVLMDSPGVLHMENCLVEGSFHALILRGARALIRDSRLVNTVEDDSLLHFFDDRDWGSQNMVNLAAITLGNKSEGYQHPTYCALVNTQVVSQGAYPAIYAYGNTADSLGVWLTCQGCTITGEIVKGNDAVNITME